MKETYKKISDTEIEVTQTIPEQTDVSVVNVDTLIEERDSLTIHIDELQIRLKLLNDALSAPIGVPIKPVDPNIP